MDRNWTLRGLLLLTLLSPPVISRQGLILVDPPGVEDAENLKMVASRVRSHFENADESLRVDLWVNSLAPDVFKETHKRFPQSGWDPSSLAEMSSYPTHVLDRGFLQTLIESVKRLWESKELEKARQGLELGLRIHPENNLEEFLFGEESGFGGWADAVISRIEIPKSRCEVSWQETADTKIYVNGFSYAGSGEIVVNASATYLFTRIKGGLVHTQWLGCGGKKSLRLGWEKASAQLPFLMPLFEGLDYRWILILKSVEGRIGAWALLPDRELFEIPGAFENGFEKNQFESALSRSPLGSAVLPRALQPLVQQNGFPSLPPAEEPKWYNNKTLWWLAGVLTAGGAAAVVGLNSRSPTKQTRITFSLE